MKRCLIAVICILAFIGYVIAADNDAIVEQVTEKPEQLPGLSVKTKPDTPVSVTIIEPDGTVFEWSNQATVTTNSNEAWVKEAINVDLSNIMELDFLTDDELNELIQKYISRKHPNSGVQIHIEAKRE